jgi:hypothetical protein
LFVAIQKYFYTLPVERNKEIRRRKNCKNFTFGVKVKPLSRFALGKLPGTRYGRLKNNLDSKDKKIELKIISLLEILKN